MHVGPRKVIASTVVLVVAVSIASIDWPAIRNRIPLSVYWQAELVFLVCLEIAYGVALLAAGVGMPVLVCLILKARRRGRVPLRLARWLVCAISLLVAMVSAEVVTKIREHWFTHGRITPTGIEPDLARRNAAGRLPQAPEPALKERFPDKSNRTGIELVVLGESSAEGVPFQRWLSIGAIVKWQLELANSGMEVRLTVLARSGDTLEKQHEALARLNRRPDLIIVYCGHNEFYSRFFAFSDLPYYFRDGQPGGWHRFAARAERLSAIGRLLRRSADQCRMALPPPAIERDLLDVPVYLEAEYPRLLADFKRRLDEIVSYANGLGALPILISPPGNDADFEPNRSFLPAATTRSERESFRRAFVAARQLEDVDPAQSMERYRELLAGGTGFAETHYRLATLLRRAGNYEEAYRHFVAARDRDGYPMRCLTAFQEAYRDVAARHDCIYIDGQSYFHSIGRHGLLDDELFQDAMHPSLKGQIALAQAVLIALQERRAPARDAGLSATAIDPAAVAAHFGLDREAWEHAARWSSGFYSLVGRLRYDQSERSRRIDEARRAADLIAAGTAPESVKMVNVGIPEAVPAVSADAKRSMAESKPKAEN